MLSLGQSRSSFPCPTPCPGQRVRGCISNPLTTLSPQKRPGHKSSSDSDLPAGGFLLTHPLKPEPGAVACPASLPSWLRMATRSIWYFRCSLGSWTLVGLSRSKGWCRMPQLRLASTWDTFHSKWVGMMTTKLMLFLKGKRATYRQGKETA